MIKRARSFSYNYDFDTVTGLFKRWGQKEGDDPEYSPFGPEILDIEVSTICHGLGTPCSWCYKSNNGVGKNMSLNTFKAIFNKMPKNLTQVAFGIGDLWANPDLFKMMSFCRERTVIPNITINGYDLTDPQIQSLSELCGAISVSRYTDKDVCYNAVERLVNRGMKQVNIHVVLSEETHLECIRTLIDIKKDPRLKGVNAVVLLMAKPKGRGHNLTPIKDVAKFRNLIKFAFKNRISIGMDSCSGPLFLKSIESINQSSLEVLSEPCESGLFSSYINVDGNFFPCSFSEGNEEWAEGISVLKANDFLKDVWFSTRVGEWRDNLLKTTQECSCTFKKSCRSCPIYDLSPCATSGVLCLSIYPGHKKQP